jgi:hypothetical protein
LVQFNSDTLSGGDGGNSTRLGDTNLARCSTAIQGGDYTVKCNSNGWTLIIFAPLRVTISGFIKKLRYLCGLTGASLTANDDNIILHNLFDDLLFLHNDGKILTLLLDLLCSIDEDVVSRVAGTLRTYGDGFG